jgi:hypothetical protein
MDLSAQCIQACAWNGVGLSPVSVVDHCEQVTPPHTPRVDEAKPVTFSIETARQASSPVLQHD